MSDIFWSTVAPEFFDESSLRFLSPKEAAKSALKPNVGNLGPDELECSCRVYSYQPDMEAFDVLWDSAGVEISLRDLFDEVSDSEGICFPVNVANLRSAIEAARELLRTLTKNGPATGRPLRCVSAEEMFLMGDGAILDEDEYDALLEEEDLPEEDLCPHCAKPY